MAKFTEENLKNKTPYRHMHNKKLFAVFMPNFNKIYLSLQVFHIYFPSSRMNGFTLNNVENIA